MSEECERTSERTSEWPSTCVPITGLSESPCIDPHERQHFFCCYLSHFDTRPDARQNVIGRSGNRVPYRRLKMESFAVASFTGYKLVINTVF